MKRTFTRQNATITFGDIRKSLQYSGASDAEIKDVFTKYRNNMYVDNASKQNERLTADDVIIIQKDKLIGDKTTKRCAALVDALNYTNIEENAGGSAFSLLADVDDDFFNDRYLPHISLAASQYNNDADFKFNRDCRRACTYAIERDDRALLGCVDVDSLPAYLQSHHMDTGDAFTDSYATLSGYKIDNDELKFVFEYEIASDHETSTYEESVGEIIQHMKCDDVYSSDDIEKLSNLTSNIIKIVSCSASDCEAVENTRKWIEADKNSVTEDIDNTDTRCSVHMRCDSAGCNINVYDKYVDNTVEPETGSFDIELDDNMLFVSNVKDEKDASLLVSDVIDNIKSHLDCFEQPPFVFANGYLRRIEDAYNSGRITVKEEQQLPALNMSLLNQDGPVIDDSQFQ